MFASLWCFKMYKYFRIVFTSQPGQKWRTTRLYFLSVNSWRQKYPAKQCNEVAELITKQILFTHFTYKHTPGFCVFSGFFMFFFAHRLFLNLVENTVAFWQLDNHSHSLAAYTNKVVTVLRQIFFAFSKDPHSSV